MIKKTKHSLADNSASSNSICFAALLWILVAQGHAQTTNATAQNTRPQIASENNAKAILTPNLISYKEIKIGMAADEVKDKLGKPKVEDKDGFYYEFSNDESAQIVLDPDKKVRVITIFYSSENKKAPKFEEVFGKDVEAETKPDGSIYKLIRYPEAGFWVAYSRSAGENPSVTVTMQKMLDIFLQQNKSQ